MVKNLMDRIIGKNSRVFIAAEISANHGQDFSRAIEMIKIAKECGVDAVKFQTYTPDTITINSDRKIFQINHSKWGGQSLYQLYEKAYAPWEWFKELKKVSDDLGLVFFSTAFDKTAVDFLEDLNVPMHKIASFELVDLPLIEYVAKTKKPLILSTGMATLPEIKEAVETAKKAGAKDIILLRCVSSYPANPEEMNLKTIPDLQRKFKVPVGLSDHTMGTGVSIAAVSLGAQFIEKHYTLSRKIDTPDNFFSLEPQELKQLVNDVRIVESSLGREFYGLTQEQKRSRVFRRSLFVTKDIKKGDLFTEENVKSIRPAYGLDPKYFKRIIGKKAKKGIRRGTPFKLDFVA